MLHSPLGLRGNVACPTFRERLEAANIEVGEVSLDGLTVAEPCAGSIASVKEAFEDFGIDIKPVNVYDYQAGLRDLARHLYGDQASQFNLGRPGGNLLDVPLFALQDAHGLISGPPCPPLVAVRVA